MKRWITAEELLELRDWTPTELLNHIKAGLPAYDQLIDIRILDLDTLPRRKAETWEEILRSPPVYELIDDALKKIPIHYDEQMLAEMTESAYVPIIPPGCEAMSFKLPSVRIKAIDLFLKILAFRFKYEDLLEYEEKNGLCVVEHKNDIVPGGATNLVLEPVKKKLTPAQQVKLEARKIVKVYVDDCGSRGSVPSIKDAVDLVKERYTKELYANRTIHNWVKGLFPDESRKPGRRPKKP